MRLGESVGEAEPEPEVEWMAPLAVSTEDDGMLLEELGLSPRVFNYLIRNDITAVGQLLVRSERSFGKKALEEIKQRLLENGLSLTVYVDKEIQCADCGSAITFTASEQEARVVRGTTDEPMRCLSCDRAHRKAQRLRDLAEGKPAWLSSEESLEELGLSRRLLNCLRKNKITKVGKLLKKSERDLMAIKMLGEKSLEELKQHLREEGLSLMVPHEVVPDEGKTLTCVDCGTTFVFTPSDQRYYASFGYHRDPKRCPACREASIEKRYESDPDRPKTYPAVCSRCHNECRVPFEPDPGRSVLCGVCYQIWRGTWVDD
jgi:CxxC-x17-CxxC domain-containing protein